MVIEKLKSPFDKELLSSMKEFSFRAERAGFSGFVGSFWEVLDSLIQTEINHRRNRLVNLLRKDERIQERYSEKEKKHHDRSILRIDKALNNFKEERKYLNMKKFDKMDKIIKDKEKFQEIRVKSIETLQDSFLEDTQDPDVVMEISEILNDVFNKVDREKGTNGLLDFIESQLVELKKVRSKEKNRGREHHSPLPWWKIIAIALWLGVAIYFVILCLIKSPESIVAFVACMVYYVGISSTAINVIKGIVAWC